MRAAKLAPTKFHPKDAATINAFGFCVSQMTYCQQGHALCL
ncbi:hypothetical protein MRB53_015372 [Persea americana]|uniref:Uncharacterized protein n=1 Tax=Persea americana TaxID=3435 RepID=A0ACC2KDM2_PERAE|nr:hypothetical protein MRB53_015372 [Persea americana]